MFRRILIANRGEIALRVIRTAREMGIETVAVFSDFDRRALHTRMAHYAEPLGGSLPRESYLDAQKVIDAALKSGAEAIHPGYGFLSENAEFAERVTKAGLTWIGPPPTAIRAMGDKITSRRNMQKAGVPVVPGILDPVATADAALVAAESIGYPVAIKAAAGGGGKGIRIVRSKKEMAGAFRTAAGEALTSFGDGRLYLERYLEEPRHIEVQVLFDRHGNGVHYGERECSIQRRHQKLIEECPSVVVTPELRAKMGAIAVQAGRAVGYENAGTVEFLYSKGEFFFLEMNTRLQVEHPVTEMVYGVDLVREQLRIAAGEELGYDQASIQARGWSIEVRINAEDPFNNFVPSTGTIKNLRAPGGPWVRLDAALYRGMEVGLNYDPMLAKLIVWGPDRATAIARMVRSLQELNVGGVRTGAPAALLVLEDERFRRGEFDTHFLAGLDLSTPRAGEDVLVAAAAAIHRHLLSRRKALSTSASTRKNWLERNRGRLTPYPAHKGSEARAQELERTGRVKYFVSVNGRAHEVDVVERLGELRVAVDGQPMELSYEEVDALGQVALIANKKSYGVSIEGDANTVSAVIAGHLYAVEIEDERERAAHAAERAQTKTGGLVKAVMPGIVAKLLVKEGDVVEAGTPLLILEAMKMQNEIASPADGIVKSIYVREREAVAGGAKLITIAALTPK